MVEEEKEGEKEEKEEGGEKEKEEKDEKEETSWCTSATGSPTF